MKSKIFEEYIKVAKEHGLIDEEDIIKEASYADARVGTDTEEKIRMMYGVKPNGSEDDTHIVDKAHPETAVVAPAYDAMNAVVENVKERQNMIAYIANKMPDGHLTGRRYVSYDQKKYESPMDAYREAADNLHNALIRIGFTMDNNDEKELMVLADSCSERFEKQAKFPGLSPKGKGGMAAAAFGLLRGGPWGALLAAVPLMLGYTALVNNNIFSQGVVIDTKKAIKELIEAQQEGYPAVQHEIANILKVLENFQIIADSYRTLEPIPLTEESNPEDLMKVRTSHDEMNKMKITSTYKTAIQQLLGYLPNAINTLKNAAERDVETSTWFAPLQWAYRQVIPSDLKDAWTHLEPLQRSLTEEMQRITNLEAAGQQKTTDFVSKFEEMVAGIQDESSAMPPEMGVAKPQAPAPKPAPKSKLPSEQSIQDILSRLSGD